MLVYGDHHQTGDPRERVRALADQTQSISPMRPGINRHAKLVELIIDAGQLLQAIADADFAEFHNDRRTAPVDALGLFVHALAGAVIRSWDSGFHDVGRLPDVPDLSPLPAQVELRTGEGFAFYTVYPEAYIEAARRLRLAAPPRVIGIRSIGTVLGAIVAATLQAPAAVTVRPFGDPFARQVAIAPELERELLADEAHFIIVDEGPGQSGSSFGAVADWLQERGVPLQRIAFVTSHWGEPGPQASDAHRQRWRNAQRFAGDFGAALPHHLEKWASGPLGPLDAPLQDISAGEWRRYTRASEQDWPPVVPAWERSKFLASARGERYLLKFAGLGAVGERKLRMARVLHAERLATEPIALVHGFIIERWHEDARALARGETPVAEIGSYIGARAALFPAHAERGATIGELLAMCRRNLSVAFGSNNVASLDRWATRVDSLSRRIVRVRTDNRLNRHKWLRLPDGQLLKTDALDHHQGHDLIGCQDMAWDLAGAVAEFELDGHSAEALIVAAEQSALRTADRELLEFYRIAYLAFRLGQAVFGAQICAGAEATRLRNWADRYTRQLHQLLHEGTVEATRQESLVD
jgi:hypothetical protein